MRCATAYYDAKVKHDAPRDAFAMMVMGCDTWKKFKNNWGAPSRSKKAPSAPTTSRRTRSATKAAAKDGASDDSDDDDDETDLHNIDESEWLGQDVGDLVLG